MTRTGRGLLIGAVLAVASTIAATAVVGKAQARSSPSVMVAELPLYATATNVAAVRLDSLFPLGSPLAKNGSLLIGNVQGVMNVALVKVHRDGTLGAPKWVPFFNLMDALADSNYQAYIRPIPDNSVADGSTPYRSASNTSTPHSRRHRADSTYRRSDRP